MHGHERLLIVWFSVSLTLCSTHYTTYKLFKTDISEMNQLRSQPTAGVSKVGCATDCVNSVDCIGYSFSKKKTRCYLMSCVNLVKVRNDRGSYEVYIQDGLVPNFLLARGKPANMSSVLADHVYSFDASKANDGIYLPSKKGIAEFASMISTAGEDKPYWRVDLEKKHCIWAVKVLNRAERAQFSGDWVNTRNAMVTIAEKEMDIFDTVNSLCAYHDGSLNQYDTLINCDTPMIGQFVQIQLNTTGLAFQAYEIDVHGI